MKIKKIIDIVSSALLVMFVIFAILLVGVRLVGIEPHIVLSGSMEPEILTGSLVYVTKLSPEEAMELKEGDVVTYIVDKRGTKVTHKIYEVVGPAYVKNQHGELVFDENGEPTVAKDGNGNPIIMYTTYGINNKNSSDPSGYTLDGKLGEGNLASSNVFGKPVFSIPYLGYVAHFVQNPPGRYVAIGVCIILIFITFFSSSVDKVEKKTAEETQADGEENEAGDKPEDKADAEAEAQDPVAKAENTNEESSEE